MGRNNESVFSIGVNHSKAEFRVNDEEIIVSWSTQLSSDDIRDIFVELQRLDTVILVYINDVDNHPKVMTAQKYSDNPELIDQYVSYIARDYINESPDIMKIWPPDCTYARIVTEGSEYTWSIPDEVDSNEQTAGICMVSGNAINQDMLAMFIIATMGEKDGGKTLRAYTDYVESISKAS